MFGSLRWVFFYPSAVLFLLFYLCRFLHFHWQGGSQVIMYNFDLNSENSALHTYESYDGIFIYFFWKMHFTRIRSISKLILRFSISITFLSNISCILIWFYLIASISIIDINTEYDEEQTCSTAGCLKFNSRKHFPVFFVLLQFLFVAVEFLFFAVFPTKMWVSIETIWSCLQYISTQNNILNTSKNENKLVQFVFNHFRFCFKINILPIALIHEIEFSISAGLLFSEHEKMSQSLCILGEEVQILHKIYQYCAINTYDQFSCDTSE